MRAADAAANLGAYSNTASATTPASPDTQPPTAPTGLTATAVSSSQINLAWTAPPTTSAVTGYRVERCQGAGCSNFAQIATPAGTTLQRHRTWRRPTSYSYRVRAQRRRPQPRPLLQHRQRDDARRPTRQPPTAPTGLTADAVELEPDQPRLDGVHRQRGVTGYRVERCQGAGCTNFAQIATPTGTTFNDTDWRRPPATATGCGRSTPPPTSAPTPTWPAPRRRFADTTPPSAPTGLTANAVGSSQINLAWTASTDNVAVTGYRVERCQGAGCSNFTQIATPSGTTFNDTDLAVATSYSYRVRAVDAATNLSPYSNVASATTPTTATGLVARLLVQRGSRDDGWGRLGDG